MFACWSVLTDTLRVDALFQVFGPTTPAGGSQPVQQVSNDPVDGHKTEIISSTQRGSHYRGAPSGAS